MGVDAERAAFEPIRVYLCDPWFTPFLPVGTAALAVPVNLAGYQDLPAWANSSGSL